VYVKALVRRGEANEKLEHFEEAIAGEFQFYSIGQGNYTNVLSAFHFLKPDTVFGNYICNPYFIHSSFA
jgi:hypothetical protein